MLKTIRPAAIKVRPFATHRPAAADIAQAMVSVEGYAYRVDFGPQVSPRIHFVSKDKTCSCQEPGCPAIEAVRQYLANGGERAPKVPFDYIPLAPTACPICGKPAYFEARLSSRKHGAGWGCSAKGEKHYWAWRTEIIKRYAAINPWRFPPVVIRDGQQLNAWDGIRSSDAVLYPGLRRDEILTA